MIEIEVNQAGAKQGQAAFVIARGTPFKEGLLFSIKVLVYKAADAAKTAIITLSSHVVHSYSSGHDFGRLNLTTAWRSSGNENQCCYDSLLCAMQAVAQRSSSKKAVLCRPPCASACLVQLRHAPSPRPFPKTKEIKSNGLLPISLAAPESSITLPARRKGSSLLHCPHFSTTRHFT